MKTSRWTVVLVMVLAGMTLPGNSYFLNVNTASAETPQHYGAVAEDNYDFRMRLTTEGERYNSNNNSLELAQYQDGSAYDFIISWDLEEIRRQNIQGILDAKVTLDHFDTILWNSSDTIDVHLMNTRNAMATPCTEDIPKGVPSQYLVDFCSMTPDESLAGLPATPYSDIEIDIESSLETWYADGSNDFITFHVVSSPGNDISSTYEMIKWYDAGNNYSGSLPVIEISYEVKGFIVTLTIDAMLATTAVVALVAVTCSSRKKQL